MEGFNKIVAIKGFLNKGLSDDLKSTFKGIVPIARPLIVQQTVKDPN